MADYRRRSLAQRPDRGGAALLVLVSLVSGSSPVRWSTRCARPAHRRAVRRREPEQRMHVMARHRSAEHVVQRWPRVCRARSPDWRTCRAAAVRLDVSHELRTPLTTVQMAGQMLYEARSRFDLHRSSGRAPAHRDRALRGAAVRSARPEPVDAEPRPRSTTSTGGRACGRRGRDAARRHHRRACGVDEPGGDADLRRVDRTCAPWSTRPAARPGSIDVARPRTVRSPCGTTGRHGARTSSVASRPVLA